jgi:CRISPR-associated protein Cas2
MLYVVSYDIPDTRRRTKLAKILKDYGDRVQYSVFECILDSGLLQEMVGKIDQIVEGRDDSVRVYSLCASCERAIRIIGKGKVTEDENIFII